jgi:thioredoxin 1
MSDSMIHTSDNDFEQDVLKSDMPVLVDFWAEWCEPCKKIAPILDELAKEYTGKIKIVKLDVQKNQAIASQYGVRGIPTLLLVKEGHVEAQKTGLMSALELKEWVNPYIS